MNLRQLFLATILAAVVVLPVGAQTRCERSHNLVGKCFWLRGRLTANQGAPTFRIWRLGTHRILGVEGPDILDSEDPNILPGAVRRHWHGAEELPTAVFGDYLVCPYTHLKPGWMQLICVAKVRNDFARER